MTTTEQESLEFAEGRISHPLRFPMVAAGTLGLGALVLLALPIRAIGGETLAQQHAHSAEIPANARSLPAAPMPATYGGMSTADQLANAADSGAYLVCPGHHRSVTVTSAGQGYTINVHCTTKG